jgi:hypothetical protein
MVACDNDNCEREWVSFSFRMLDRILIGFASSTLAV